MMSSLIKTCAIEAYQTNVHTRISVLIVETLRTFFPVYGLAQLWWLKPF